MKIFALTCLLAFAVGCATKPPPRVSGTDPVWWANFNKGGPV